MSSFTKHYGGWCILDREGELMPFLRLNKHDAQWFMRQLDYSLPLQAPFRIMRVDLTECTVHRAVSEELHI